MTRSAARGKVSRSPARRPLPRGSLSRTAIVTAALVVIDAEGLDALTMRHLASELGSEAMSLYKHVPDKQTLLDLVVEQVLSDFVPPDPDLPWETRTRLIADRLRRLALQHPHVFPLLAVRLPTSPVALAPVEASLSALTDAGLDDDDVIAAFWALVSYTTGALLGETAALTGTEQPFPYQPAGPDPTTLPNLTRLSAKLASGDYATEYRRGLTLLIESIVDRTS